MEMKRSIIYIFLFVAAISASYGQNVNVTSSFDSTRIYIGDQIKYTIKIDQPAGLNLTLPFFKDTLCKNIEILSGPVVDSSSLNDGRIRIVEQYLITSFDSGLYQIPPVFVELKNENGLKRFYSEYSQLEVLRVKIAPPDATAKIYDIIDPYKAPLTIGEILPWVLLIIIFGAIIWFIIRYIKRIRLRRPGVETVIMTDPAHIIAFRDLEKLREEELWQRGEIKSYYTKLTDILRLYLENRYKIYSLELTTSETLSALIKAGFKKDESYNNLKAVLTGADLVKFAKSKPESSENELHFQNSWAFVDLTKEVEVKINEGVGKDIVREGSI